MRPRYLILISGVLFIIAAIINKNYFYIYLITMYTVIIWILDKALEDVTDTLEELLR